MRSILTQVVALAVIVPLLAQQTEAIALPAPEPTGGVVPVVAALSVASTVLDIALKVKSLFAKNGGDDEAFQKEVLQRLSRIESQLSNIQNELTEINTRLDQLQVHIDKQFEYQRVVDIITAVRRVDQSYGTWVKADYSPEKYPAAPAPGQILEKLREASTAARVYPSYANFSSVALAMAYEHLILTNVFHTASDDDEAMRGYAQYAEFFQNAASIQPENVGSVGLTWKSITEAQAANLAAFNALPRPLRCEEGGNICCPSNPHDPNWWYEAAKVNRYEGDLIAGFHVAATEARYFNGPGGSAENDCRPSDSPKYTRVPVCPVNVGGASNVACSLGTMHQTALDQKQQADDISASLDALKSYYTQAAIWSGKPLSKIKFHDPRPPAPKPMVAVATKVPKKTSP